MKRISLEQQEVILEVLEDALNRSEKLWKSKEESHAFIIGYLQGAVKMSIKELNKV